MDLVEFLRQRLADDEAAAHCWSEHDWHACGDEVLSADCLVVAESGAAEHIARHDPARVLREVEADRRLIEQYEAMRAGAEAAAGTILAGAAKVRLGAYEFALKCRALPHADHPDYRESWKP